MRRLVVLASGTGTNLQAVLDATASGRLPATVVAVVSDRVGAGALERAAKADIQAIALVPEAGEARRDYDRRLAERVARARPDWVVLAGWMRLLSMAFLARFPARVVNLHPALPGAFPGTRAIARALDSARRGEIDRTGVMVHLVPDEGIDDGPVLAVREVPILAGDDLAALEARIHAVEHDALVDTLARLCTGSVGPP